MMSATGCSSSSEFAPPEVAPTGVTPAKAVPTEAAPAKVVPTKAAPAKVAPLDERPGSRQVVALLQDGGGYIRPGFKAIEPAEIIVYGDGLAVADADRRLRLTPADVTALVRSLRKDLVSQPPSPTPSGSRIYDATTATLGVWTGGRTLRTISAYALHEGYGGGKRYPDSLYHAQETLTTLADRVRREGTGYRADRVRLVAEQRRGEKAKMTWPSQIPEPAKAEGDVLVRNLTGGQARAVIRSVARHKGLGAWPLYRDSQGRVFAMTWRFLLPSE
ncbi:hypothetical protein [Nonomuraea sp. NPDC049400]|uniref:hypothetical protein n=1 Tax=Nonomuraea sp. NPDC049400 TaxID=3364352 RepID=UPI0037A3636F